MDDLYPEIKNIKLLCSFEIFHIHRGLSTHLIMTLEILAQVRYMALLAHLYKQLYKQISHLDSLTRAYLVRIECLICIYVYYYFICYIAQHATYVISKVVIQA